MISSIHLKNFQGHRDTSLEFGPGINVIAGQSDAGKSSIIRAIWWLLKNRPSGGGETFKFSGIERGGEVSATVTLEDSDGSRTEVTRFYKGGKNGYRVGDQELVAIKTDVPQEVLNALDMDDHNVQPQHQPYFLLADGPAEVARKLNAICGLDIIDQCLKTASLLVSRNSSYITETKTRIEFTKTELERYKDIPEREAQVQLLEGKEESRQGVVSDRVRLEQLINNHTQASKVLRDIGNFLEAEPRVQRLLSKQEELSSARGRIERLEGLMNNALRTQALIGQASLDLKYREEEFHRMLQELGRCPLCEREIS